MTIAEPTTMLTDYVLAGLCGLCARWLWHDGYQAEQAGRCSWAAGLGCLGIAALAGGTVHGFSASLDPELLRPVWKFSVYAVGVASFFLLIGTLYGGVPPGNRRVLLWIPVVQLAGYSLWMATHDDFRFVLYNYAFTLIMVLAVHLYESATAGGRVAWWMIGGVLVSAAAGAIQAMGFSIHRHFNHNDLYHVVQMAGIYGLYRGANRLKDQ